MNCFDCTLAGLTTPAVAVCHDCGAAVCLEHAFVRRHHLTRTATINRIIVVEPPARVLRCATCTAAIEAVDRDSAPRHRHSEKHASV
jgi:hypothetical protein